MTRLFFLFLILFISTSFGFSQYERPNEMILEFIKTYEKQGISKSLDEIYSTNPWRDEISNFKAVIANEFSKLDTNIIGAYLGFTKISEKGFSKDYVIIEYLMKYERQPFKVSFTFYLPQKEWRLLDFSLSDIIN